MKTEPAHSRRTLRVGLVGVTGYGLSYHQGLKKMHEAGRIEWMAVTVINPDEAAEQIRYYREGGIPVHADFDTMLREEKERMDWVCIPTGIGDHTWMTIDCLREGLHVLVEKPLAPTLQEVAAIQAAELESGCRVGVGFQHLYLEDTWEIKRRLWSGEIGSLERIDAIGLWPRPQSYYHRNDWSGRLHDGRTWILDSPLQNALSHVVNLILFFAGPEMDQCADLTHVTAELYRSKVIESFDTIRTVGTMDGGLEAAIILSHGSSNSIDPEIRVTGSRGSLVWRFDGNHTFTVDGVTRLVRTIGPIAMREGMLESMAAWIAGKPARICSTAIARGPCQWVNAVHDTAPIHDIPSRYLHRIRDNAGEIHDTIENLEYHALRAFQERRALRETGASWAVAASARDLAGYNAFEGALAPQPVPSIPEGTPPSHA